MNARTFDLSRRADNRKPLPSWELIKAITDYAVLEQMLPDIDAHITAIETDLEFRDGDDDWYARARGALTAHKICRKHIERRMRQVQPKGPKASPQPSETKTERLKLRNQHEAHVRATAEAKAERQKANLQHDLETRRLATDKRVAQAMHVTSLGNAFMRAAQRVLPAEQFAEILETATNMVEHNARTMVERPKPTESAAAEATA